MLAPRTALVLALCATLPLAACGRSDEREVRDALERYAQAVERKDYQALCDDLLSRRLIDNLRRVGAPCETALQRGLRDVEKPSIVVESVKVNGDTASAVARTDAANEEPSKDTIQLAKEDGEWKVVDLSSS
ncbi:MAG TPA: nuclear transport factor 2 family protein [Solirubrobacteraceae bacterium]|nr:nuclear transport factor 2 family protein [Solirubrobacteraceae bacterium]